MRKVIAFLLTLTLLIGGLILANNIAQQSQEQPKESKEAVEVSDQQPSKYPPLHYFRQDRYPTKEELPQFHIFKGQFPLDNRDGNIELHNFNED